MNSKRLSAPLAAFLTNPNLLPKTPPPKAAPKEIPPMQPPTPPSPPSVPAARAPRGYTFDTPETGVFVLRTALGLVYDLRAGEVLPGAKERNKTKPDATFLSLEMREGHCFAFVRFVHGAAPHCVRVESLISGYTLRARPRPAPEPAAPTEKRTPAMLLALVQTQSLDIAELRQQVNTMQTEIKEAHGMLVLLVKKLEGL